MGRRARSNGTTPGLFRDAVVAPRLAVPHSVVKRQTGIAFVFAVPVALVALNSS